VTVFSCGTWAVGRSQLPLLQWTGRAVGRAACSRPLRTAHVRTNGPAVSPPSPCLGGLHGDSEVPRSSLTHVLGARGQSGRALPTVPFWVSLCGMEPCQPQQFTLQVKPDQKMCARRTPSAFLLGSTQSMG